MPVFNYKIRDADGNLVEGQTEALSADALANQFQVSHAIPLSISEVIAKKKSAAKKSLVTAFKKIPFLSLVS